MTQFTKVTLPDIGDFQEVPVVEILVSPGDEVIQETPLLVLETDKASMEVPAPQAGIVREIHVKAGDRISQGSLLVTLEIEEKKFRQFQSYHPVMQVEPIASQPLRLQKRRPGKWRQLLLSVMVRCIPKFLCWELVRAAILRHFVLQIWVSRLC